MTISLDTISPTDVSEDGGYLLRVIGDFGDHLGELFQVHIGPNGDSSDDPCPSGIPGQGQEVYPLNATELRCYTPCLDPGTYDVFVRRTDDSTSDVLVGVIQYHKKGFETSVYDLRRVVPPYYFVGPKSIEVEEPV
jgi:hypothetical protein